MSEYRYNLSWHTRQLIMAALVRTGGHRTQAAALLGITRHALTRKMAKFAVHRPQESPGKLACTSILVCAACRAYRIDHEVDVHRCSCGGADVLTPVNHGP